MDVGEACPRPHLRQFTSAQLDLIPLLFFSDVLSSFLLLLRARSIFLQSDRFCLLPVLRKRRPFSRHGKRESKL